MKNNNLIVPPEIFELAQCHVGPIHAGSITNCGTRWTGFWKCKNGRDNFRLFLSIWDSNLVKLTKKGTGGKLTQVHVTRDCFDPVTQCPSESIVFYDGADLDNRSYPLVEVLEHANLFLLAHHHFIKYDDAIEMLPLPEGAV
jgi:hypothetical protein